MKCKAIMHCAVPTTIQYKAVTEGGFSPFKYGFINIYSKCACIVQWRSSRFGRVIDQNICHCFKLSFGGLISLINCWWGIGSGKGRRLIHYTVLCTRYLLFMSSYKVIRCTPYKNSYKYAIIDVIKITFFV